MPHTMRNPAYHWTHLELHRPFGITDRLFTPDTAKGIWEECNAKLATPKFSARGIMKQMGVVLVCTTDDPTDSLEYHRMMADDGRIKTIMLPTWRPDKALAIENPEIFNPWIARLEAASGIECATFDLLLEALHNRAQFLPTAAAKLPITASKYLMRKTIHWQKHARHI